MTPRGGLGEWPLGKDPGAATPDEAAQGMAAAEALVRAPEGASPAVSAESPVSRWSRRIAHPRMTIRAEAPLGDVLDALAADLDVAGFRVRDRDAAGFEARRIPWFDWLSTAAVSSCVLLVRSHADHVEVYVKDVGATPAPRRVAEAVGATVARFRDRGVVIEWSEWEPTP